MKIALFILCDTDRLENLGRMSNAFMIAKEALENDDDLKFIFSGAGTKWIAELEKEMLQAAEALEFERAAVLRDRLKSLQKTSRRS